MVKWIGSSQVKQLLLLLPAAKVKWGAVAWKVCSAGYIFALLFIFFVALDPMTFR